MKKLRYPCPCCGYKTLVVDKNGYIVCSLIGCDDPLAFTRLIENEVEA